MGRLNCWKLFQIGFLMMGKVHHNSLVFGSLILALVFALLPVYGQVGVDDVSPKDVLKKKDVFKNELLESINKRRVMPRGYTAGASASTVGSAIAEGSSHIPTSRLFHGGAESLMPPSVRLDIPRSTVDADPTVNHVNCSPTDNTVIDRAGRYPENGVTGCEPVRLKLNILG